MSVTASDAGLSFSDGWSRATSPGSTTAVVYGLLSNNGNEVIGINRVESEIADKVMIHQSIQSNGMMRMRHVENLLLKPGQKVELAPGGYHMMLMHLHKPLLAGNVFAITIVTGDQHRIEATIKVGSMGQIHAPTNTVTK